MDAADAFSSAEPAILPALDAWVAATPGSFAPYLARATHWTDAGHARRGSRWSKDTPADDMAQMREAFTHAKPDLDHAIALRPKQTAAHRLRIQIARHEGDAKLAERTISTALAACPSCLRIRITYVVNAAPRWGGSYPEIERFVKQSAGSGPAMQVLPGFVDLLRAQDLQDAKQIPKALAALDHACALGERWEFFAERARLQTWDGDKAKALADAEHAAGLAPGNPDVLQTRAAAHLALKHYEPAGADLRAVFAAEPTHESGKRMLSDVVAGLVWQAEQYRQAGRREDAIRLYDLAAELTPDDPRIAGYRSWTILGDAGAPGSIEQLEAAAKQAPDDFAIHQQLDYALAKQNQFPRVVEMWTTFLAAHPDNARAYLERGGAHIHMGKRAEAKADATKACELGLSEACARVKRLP